MPPLRSLCRRSAPRQRAGHPLPALRPAQSSCLSWPRSLRLLIRRCADRSREDRMRVERGVVTVMRPFVAAPVLFSAPIASQRPDAVIIQIESAESTPHKRDSPAPAETLRNVLFVFLVDLVWSQPT